LSRDILLQIAIKAVNNTAGLNSLILILFVFGAYLRIANTDALYSSVARRAAAIAKAIKEVRKDTAERQVRDVLSMRNSPNTLNTLNLLFLSEVRVWREKVNSRLG
jgi:hypothetical protein